MAISIESGTPTKPESEIREDIKERAEDVAVSAKYTYDQHFSAGNFYRYLDLSITLIVGILSTWLTINLIWENSPTRFLIASAVMIGGLEGVRLAVSPRKKARKLHQSAQSYQSLFERVIDFQKLEIPRKESELDDLIDRYQEFNAERLDLNERCPDLSSFWYLYIKLVKPNGGLGETVASDNERSMINGGLRRE